MGSAEPPSASALARFGVMLLIIPALLLAACSDVGQPFAISSEEKAALAPPIDITRARAGPGAEKDIDYETLYGPGMTGPPQLAVATEPTSVQEPEVAPDPNKPAIRAVAVAAVTGAPGSGNDELATALKRVLTDAGWPVATAKGDDTLAIEGIVKVGEPKGTAQKVALRWTVTTPDGRVVGTVEQANDVPAGSLDEGWGDTADHAAQAAAEGIFDIVDKLR